MKEIGKKINKMGQVRKVGLMELHMKVNINKVKKVAKVNLSGQMVVLMKANLKIII